jgi:hypothetical protein
MPVLDPDKALLQPVIAPPKKPKKKKKKPALIAPLGAGKLKLEMERELRAQQSLLKRKAELQARAQRAKAEALFEKSERAKYLKGQAGLQKQLLAARGVGGQIAKEYVEEARSAIAGTRSKYVQDKQTREFVSELTKLSSTNPSLAGKDAEKVFLSLSDAEKLAIVLRHPAAFPELTREALKAQAAYEKAKREAAKKPGIGQKILGAIGKVLGPLDKPRSLLGQAEAAEKLAKAVRERKTTVEKLWARLSPDEQADYVLRIARFPEGEGYLRTIFGANRNRERIKKYLATRSGEFLRGLQRRDNFRTHEGSLGGDFYSKLAQSQERRDKLGKELGFVVRHDTGITQFALDPTLYLPSLGALRTINTAAKSEKFLQVGGRRALERIAAKVALIGENAAKIAERFKLPVELAEKVALAAGDTERVVALLAEELGKTWTPTVTRRSIAALRPALKEQGLLKRGLETAAAPRLTEAATKNVQKALTLGAQNKLRAQLAKGQARIANINSRLAKKEAQLKRLTPARQTRAVRLRQDIVGLRLQRKGLSKQATKLDKALRAGRIVEKQVIQKAERRGLRSVTGQGAARLARAPLAFIEKATPGKFKHELKDQAADAVRRYTRGLGLGHDIVDGITNRVIKAGTIDDAESAVAEAVRHYAAKAGLDSTQSAQLLAFMKSAKDEFDRAFKARLYGIKGEAAPLARTQLRNEILLPDKGDLDRAIKQIRSGRAVTGRAGLAVRGLKAGHRLWKFGVVTGPAFGIGLAGSIPGAAIGATIGVIKHAVPGAVKAALKGDLDHLLLGIQRTKSSLLKGAAGGAHIGASVGGLQYSLRVAVIEETFGRSFAVHGITRSVIERLPFGLGPKILWKGLNENQRKIAVNTVRMLRHAVRANPENDWALHAFLTKASKSTLIEQGDRRFLDAWYHVINYQLHQSDDVIRHLMAGRFGDSRIAVGETGEAIVEATSREAAQAAAIRWLEHDPRGKVYLRDMIEAGRAKNAKQLVDNAQTLIDEVVTHPAIVKAWQAGPVDKGELRALIAKGAAPQRIHALDRRTLNPLNPKDLQEVVSRSVLQAPTNVGREGFFLGEFTDHYKSLLDGGMDPSLAAQIAGRRAVERTNEIMFSLDGMSRFAKKADYVFPFQQVREELFRVYGKIALDNPLRTMRLYKAAKTGFDIGVEEGWIYKDQYGEYVVTIPGSAALTRLLTGRAIAKTLPLSRLSFIGQGAFGIGVIPTPGGPYFSAGASVVLRAFPDLFPKNDTVAKWLFPFGASGYIGRENVRQIIAGIQPGFGGAFYEVVGKDNQRDQLYRLAHRVYSAMYVDWKEGHGPEPTLEAVKDAVKKLTFASGILGAIVPGGGQFLIPEEERFYNDIAPAFRDASGRLDIAALLEEFPQYQPYLTSKGKYIGPEKYWQQPGLPREAMSEADKFKSKLNTKVFSPEEFAAEIKRSQQLSLAFKDFYESTFDPTDVRGVFERQDAVLRRHPELRHFFDTRYQMELQYIKIRRLNDPKEQDRLLKEWRFRWKDQDGGWSKSAEEKLSFRYVRGVLDPEGLWNAARDADELDRMWRDQKSRHSDLSLRQFASRLSASEAIKFLRRRERDAETLDEYFRIHKLISETYDNHPELLAPRKIDPLRDSYEQKLARELSAKTSDFYEDMAKLQTRVDQIKKQMDAAAQSKNWTLYYSLKDRRTKAYDQIRILKNAVYHKYQDWPLIADTLKEGWYDEGLTTFHIKELEKQGLGWLAIAPEEKQWQNMTELLRDEYLKDLTGRLSQPAFSKGKLYWEWLTDFQKDLLQGQYGYDKAKQWALRSAADDAAARKRGGMFSVAEGEIAFAMAMFNQYSKRPRGARPPAAYKQYLSLPDNRAVRFAFLQQHPEVQRWLQLGPMAQMPVLLRNLVANIMIKHGKWQGEGRTIDEITEVSFAQLQLQKWTKRRPGERPPATFDLWLNMPTGPGKAAYLRKHPEIQDWLSRGPMSNMPDNLKDVVREILVNYGVFTEKSDPLSKLIGEYSKLPASAKAVFLAQHPELVEYWRALRPPEERPLFDLASRYFAIDDTAAKRMFLEVHPELKDYFIRERERRYERFLNRVSFYLGANPELINGYLSEQTRILSALLDKFGERPLLPEKFVTRSRSRRAA